ncbi:MAG: efflux RND transporter periplasmic adaptor subunit [Rhodospirillaceae bacterium]|nr:efflux RND transporter periplasmic adaptor subunit [Rhodospirillaceae bacterium]
MGFSLGVVAGAAALFTLSACGPDGGGGPPAPPVTVAKPLVKEVTEWDEYTGRFQAMESVEIRARVSGYLTDINFKDGEMVKAGDLLFVIDPRPYQSALDQARAAFVRAQTQQQLAGNDLERATRLLQTKAVSVEEYDTRLQRKKEADAAVEGAKASLRNAELDLEFTQIRSPITGRVGATALDVGNLVTGGAGAVVLTTVVSLDPMHFVFDASELAYLRYQRMSQAGDRASSRDVANPVQVRLSDETTWTRTGVMDFVDNQINPRTGTIRGRAVLANPDLFLTPGTFGRLRLLGATYQATLIPDAAIISDQARKIAAVVAADGTVSFKPVELGPLIDGLRVVRSGLNANDRVVINGLLRVRPGAKVQPTESQIASAPEAKPDTAKTDTSKTGGPTP